MKAGDSVHIKRKNGRHSKRAHKVLSVVDGKAELEGLKKKYKLSKLIDAKTVSSASARTSSQARTASQAHTAAQASVIVNVGGRSVARAPKVSTGAKPPKSYGDSYYMPPHWGATGQIASIGRTDTLANGGITRAELRDSIRELHRSVMGDIKGITAANNPDAPETTPGLAAMIQTQSGVRDAGMTVSEVDADADPLVDPLADTVRDAGGDTRAGGAGAAVGAAEADTTAQQYAETVPQQAKKPRGSWLSRFKGKAPAPPDASRAMHDDVLRSWADVAEEKQRALQSETMRNGQRDKDRYMRDAEKAFDESIGRFFRD